MPSTENEKGVYSLGKHPERIHDSLPRLATRAAIEWSEWWRSSDETYHFDELVEAMTYLSNYILVHHVRLWKQEQQHD